MISGALTSPTAPADHEALVADLKKRMIAAMLLLGELRGSEEYKAALRQGHAEAWASENLSKVLKEDSLVGEVATVSHNTHETARGLLTPSLLTREPS